MTSKFKIEYYHKIPQTTSPYLQLLEAKKKIFGYKYQLIRNEKSSHNKSIGPTNQQPSHKHSKTMSHEKQKPRSQKQNSRKKRSHTEHEERLHQSLFLNRQHTQPKHQATKSLFAVQPTPEHSLNPHEFIKHYRNLNSESNNTKSLTQQIQSKAQNQVNSLQKLEIRQIDDLIALIDGCVEEANDYIGYLSQKIESLKQENSKILQQQVKLIRMKDGIINQKQVEIDRLKKQLIAPIDKDIERNFEIGKLLEVISKLSEENKTLKVKIKELQLGETNEKKEKEGRQRDKKDIYNSIHNKIDILNISIDKKNQEESGGQPRRLKNNPRPKFYK